MIIIVSLHYFHQKYTYWVQFICLCRWNLFTLLINKSIWSDFIWSSYRFCPNATAKSNAILLSVCSWQYGRFSISTYRTCIVPGLTLWRQCVCRHGNLFGSTETIFLRIQRRKKCVSVYAASLRTQTKTETTIYLKPYTYERLDGYKSTLPVYSNSRALCKGIYDVYLFIN